MRDLILHTKVRRYSREYAKAYTLKPSDWDGSVATWVWPFLQDLCSQAKLSPVSSTIWDGLRQGLPLLSRLPEWAVISKTPLAELAPEQIARLYSQMDDALLSQYGHSRAHRISVLCRGKIRAYIAFNNPKGRSARLHVHYVSKIKEPPRQGRGLISDLVVDDELGEPELPVGALKHGTAADLKQKASEKLERDLQRIVDCCLLELDGYEESLALLQRLVDEATDEAAETDLTSRAASKSWRLRAEDHRGLIRLYLRVDLGLQAAPAFCEREYKFATELQPALAAILRAPDLPFTRLLRLHLYPPATVLVACVLLIQIKTRWNISSVLDLASNKRHTSKPPFHIQSVKGKTGDETPPVLMEEADAGALHALKLMEDRLHRLKATNAVLESESRLWLSPRREFSTGRFIQISNWSAQLRRFQNKHGLPAFSFEQVRDQALTLRALTKGGLVAAMESAGHADIATLTSYVQNIITKRLASATNLEFQRRWDAAIRYQLDPASVKAGTLLIPLGDGASCADPMLPPESSWLQFGVCEGTQCHVGEGCRNRRLVIDVLRIEEVVRTNRFYLSGWQSLLGRNPDAFVKSHLPAMLFNIALLATIKRGPYRHLVKTHE